MDQYRNGVKIMYRSEQYTKHLERITDFSKVLPGTKLFYGCSLSPEVTATFIEYNPRNRYIVFENAAGKLYPTDLLDGWYFEPSETYSIYQLKDIREFGFLTYDMLMQMGRSVQKEDYQLVYKAPLEMRQKRGDLNLEDIFIKYNTDIPDDFKGHSLSVSDVIVIQDGEKAKAYYIDSLEFKEIKDWNN